MVQRPEDCAEFWAVARLGGSALLVAMALGFWPKAANCAEPAMQNAGAESRELRAGPVRLKLADGQLRYVRLGDKEIIRRVYFAVRDDHWRTPMPQFTEYRVEDGQDHFTVHLSATCKLDQIDYRWTGTITGTPDGRVEFEAGGAPAADFRSNRIGFCILYGIPSLLGQPFTTEGPTAMAKGVFPQLASPSLVARQFRKLAYTTPQGMTVTTTVDGAVCDMEDQRNWGDTSWKEYAPLPYAYPIAPKGKELRQKVTITVAGFDSSARRTPEEQILLKLGNASPGLRIPRIVPADALKGAAGFSDVNMHRDRFKGQSQVVWAYTPAEHLPDRDNLMDNVPGVMYQAQAAHAFAPQAKLGVGPVSFAPEKWPGHEPPDSAPYAAAWAAGFVQYAAMGGVEQVAFELGHGPAEAIIRDLQSHQGQPVRVADSSRPDVPVSALSVEADGAQTVWVANRTGAPVEIMLEGLGGARQASLTQLSVEGQRKSERAADVIEGRMPLDLGPFEVLRISTAK